MVDGSAYLWAYRRAEKKAAAIIEQDTIETLKELAAYETGVCGYCPQVYCEVDKMIACYEIFNKKGLLKEV